MISVRERVSFTKVRISQHSKMRGLWSRRHTFSLCFLASAAGVGLRRSTARTYTGRVSNDRGALIAEKSLELVSEQRLCYRREVQEMCLAYHGGDLMFLRTKSVVV